jgi:hypothetical protein
MEGLFQAWVIIKWLFIASLGSALAVFLNKTERTKFEKAAWFFFGAVTSIILGPVFIEWREIHSQAMQGLVYYAFGLWGMGLAIQTAERAPFWFRSAVEKWLSK